MQPSTYDIQREVEALRDIKRRSTTPGALAIDPDLPNQSSPVSPTSTYWSGAQTSDGDSSSSSHDDGSSSDHGSSMSGIDGPNNPADDPFHLFWVPASVHPEIAPAEFRAFLKEHARSPPPGDGSITPSRSSSISSLSSGGLGRKKSMLSRQYRPSENDGVEEEEKIVPLRRNRSSLLANRGPQLTISDLQKLEELAEEASESDDPSKLRSVLRRSLSLNVSPTSIDTIDAIPEMGDEADAPIIVPPPGQILRRAARTRIRKGSAGEGGSRFGSSTRRGPSVRSGTAPITLEKRTSSDRSSNDHGEPDVLTAAQRRRTFENETQARPESYSEEAFIFDAYVREDDEESNTPVVIPPSPADELAYDLPSIQTSTSPDDQTSLLQALEPVLHHPQPQRLLAPEPSADQRPPSRTPSPQESLAPSVSPSHSPDPPTGSSPPAFLHVPPSPPAHHRKEKDKKGLFGKWGSDKGGKKLAKEKERDSGDKEKESGFFGSLFGGKKSKESDGPPSMGISGGAAGREAAAALLGASKSSKSYVPPPSPNGSQGGPGVNNWSRYPIHVERAIYRLSHIKLANPRRPLYEQVLISNLMFWYLGVIKAQNPTTPANGQANAAGTGAGNQDKEQKEHEQREREQKERAERERAEQERLEREQMESKKREASPRRGALTKAPPGGGGRRAEIPVKGPQYEMQHRVMEQEYSYGGYNDPPNRTSSAPPNMGMGQPYRMQQQPQMYSNMGQGTVDPNAPEYYYPNDMMQNQQQQRLPPGAMAPLDQSGWQQPQGRANSTSPPSASGPRRSRSPPPHEMMSGGRTPGRSLSATVLPSQTPPHVNGKVRKGHSAYAGMPSSARRPRTAEDQDPQANGFTEDEDVPLALWQQQQHRRR